MSTGWLWGMVGSLALTGCVGAEPASGMAGGGPGLDAGVQSGGSLEVDQSLSMMPLELGRSWSYVLSPIDPTSTSGCPRTTTAITQRIELFLDDTGGVTTAWVYLPTCRSDAMVLWESRGIHYGLLLADPTDPSAGTIGSRLTVLVDPTVASSFAASTTDATRYEWSPLGTTETVAGSFSDCYDRRLVGADSSAVYCRGVGLVRVRSGSQNLELELESMVVP